MKFTRVVLLCNLCWQDTSGDVETPATRTLIFKTSDETDDFFRVDVCQNHSENGVSLDEILAAAEPIDPGTPATHRGIGRPRKAALDMTETAHICPVCGHVYASKGGVSLHMKAKHKAEWEQLVIERSADVARTTLSTQSNGK